jgi:hypothetical protein
MPSLTCYSSDEAIFACISGQPSVNIRWNVNVESNTVLVVRVPWFCRKIAIITSLGQVAVVQTLLFCLSSESRVNSQGNTGSTSSSLHLVESSSSSGYDWLTIDAGTS